jgi:hypothetical protein
MAALPPVGSTGKSAAAALAERLTDALVRDQQRRATEGARDRSDSVYSLTPPDVPMFSVGAVGASAASEPDSTIAQPTISVSGGSSGPAPAELARSTEFNTKSGAGALSVFTKPTGSTSKPLTNAKSATSTTKASSNPAVPSATKRKPALKNLPAASNIGDALTASVAVRLHYDSHPEITGIIAPNLAAGPELTPLIAAAGTGALEAVSALALHDPHATQPVSLAEVPIPAFQVDSISLVSPEFKQQPPPAGSAGLGDASNGPRKKTKATAVSEGKVTPFPAFDSAAEQDAAALTLVAGTKRTRYEDEEGAPSAVPGSSAIKKRPEGPHKSTLPSRLPDVATTDSAGPAAWNELPRGSASPALSPAMRNAMDVDPPAGLQAALPYPGYQDWAMEEAKNVCIDVSQNDCRLVSYVSLQNARVAVQAAKQREWLDRHQLATAYKYPPTAQKPTAAHASSASLSRLSLQEAVDFDQFTREKQRRSLLQGLPSTVRPSKPASAVKSSAVGASVTDSAAKPAVSGPSRLAQSALRAGVGKTLHFGQPQPQSTPSARVPPAVPPTLRAMPLTSPSVTLVSSAEVLRAAAATAAQRNALTAAPHLHGGPTATPAANHAQTRLRLAALDRAAASAAHWLFR